MLTQVNPRVTCMLNSANIEAGVLELTLFRHSLPATCAIVIRVEFVAIAIDYLYTRIYQPRPSNSLAEIWSWKSRRDIMWTSEALYRNGSRTNLEWGLFHRTEPNRTERNEGLNHGTKFCVSTLEFPFILWPPIFRYLSVSSRHVPSLALCCGIV